MIKKFLAVSIFALMVVGCNTEPEPSVCIGKIADFEFHMGSMVDVNRATIFLEDGRKVIMKVGYRDDIRTGLYLHRQNGYYVTKSYCN